MKLAIMLAGMASGNKIARDPAQLLAQGTKLVQSSPQLTALSDQVRGRLVDAGKGIAVAVVSKQMDSLSDRLSERTERLGRLDERTGALRATRTGRATDEAGLDDDWVDDDRADDGVDEDRAEQDRGAQQVAPPRSRRTTAAGTSGAGRRSVASPSRKHNDTSSAINGSEKATGSTVRSRTAGGSQRGERNA